MEDKTIQTTEQTILEVAERLFLEKGFASTSTTEIARVAGCNQALIHYYFRTKDNLFNTIFENKFNAFFQHLFQLNLLEKLPFQEKLRYIIETHYDLIRENPRLPLVIINELSRQPEQLKNLREKLHAIPEQLFVHLESELQLEIQAGRIRPVSLMDLIVSMVSLNVALFLLMPVAGEVLSLSKSQTEIMFEHRRIEHVNIILNNLRP